MAIKNTKMTKKLQAKVVASKSKKSVKSNKPKVDLVRLNVNIPKILRNKAKQFAIKNNLTIQTMISEAIKKYINSAIKNIDTNV